MNLRIRKMTIENFKGIKSLEVEVNGKNAVVYGDNATGKTSIFDAFLWLLFGKDSTDRSDFGVKPYDKDGHEIHNLETVVEAEMEIDGLKIATLKHMMKENWVKKNGQSEQVFSGNQHKYWVNGISHSASDYEKFVGSIAPKKIFPIITNPMAFNSLKWQERRDVLLRLCPVDIDAAILAHPDYACIALELSQRGTDIYGLKKLKREQKARDDKEMEQIPVRIAELQRLMDPAMDGKYEEAVEKKGLLEKRLAALVSSDADASESLSGIRSLAEDLMRFEANLQTLKLGLSRSRQNTRMDLSQQLAMARSNLAMALQSKSAVEKQKESCEAALRVVDEKILELRNRWYKADEQTFVAPKSEDICPRCGQPLPEAMKEAAIAKAKEAFESKKERMISEISEEGTAARQQAKQLQETISKHADTITALEAKADRCENQIAGIEAELRIYEGEVDFSKYPEIVELEKAIESKRSEYETAKRFITPAENDVERQKKQLSQQIQEAESVISAKRQQDSVASRILELEGREKELGAEIAKTEQDLILIDSFVTARCKALEESVNTLFPSVRWKLFDVQINAGIKDTCVCLIDGVPFMDANNAAKINAGLEIIDVLSRFYEASVPVFVDNAESVNNLRKIKGQRIALTVSHDPELRIEVQDNERMVA